MRRIILALATAMTTMVFSAKGMAQGRHNAQLDSLLATHERLWRVDSLLKRAFYAKDIDTAYITRPQTRWTLKMRANLSGRQSEFSSEAGDIPVEMSVVGQRKGTISMAVGYRGISFGLAVNPAKLTGKNKETELNLVSYGNRYGFEVSYEDSRRMTAELTADGQTYALDGLSTRLRAVNATGYYALNYRRFSFPAAFSQSYIQRRSSGSLLFGFSFFGGRTEVDANEQYGTPDVLTKSVNLSIGAGYGYNYVPHRKWLLHVSALPTVIVFKHERLLLDGEATSRPHHFPDVDVAVRAAAIYSFENYFTGLTFTGNTMRLGSKDNLLFTTTKWRTRFVFGLRL